MVNTLFTWLYGGRQVFLSGSFVGWREQIAMIMAEGSGTIFQRIVDLPPGYHQYKYMVDGVWRVDEEQLCVQNDYGTINNIVLVKEPESVSPFLCSIVHSTAELGNGRTMHLQASSSSGPNQLLMQLPDNEMDVSRYHILMHLSSSKTYELIPNSGKVIAVDVEVAMKQAFHVMYEEVKFEFAYGEQREGLAVLPVLDEHSTQILGMLTASDFIMILMELQKTRALQTDEELEMHTVSAWKDGKFERHRQLVGSLTPSSRRSLIQASPDESLKDVALRILQNDISAVPILHSTDDDGPCPRLLHVACLAGILKYICRHFKPWLEYLPFLKQQVGDLPFGTWAGEVGRSRGRILLTLRATDPLSSALNLLLQAHVSSIPIVDDDGNLINVYSRRDITSLAKGCLYAKIRLDQTVLHQALEVLDEAPDWRYQTCTRFEPLYRAMELLSDPAVRRVIVVDPSSQQVEGIITLRDVFSLLLGIY